MTSSPSSPQIAAALSHVEARNASTGGAAIVDGAESSFTGAGGKLPMHYLSRTEVAAYMKLAGLHSLTGVQLPPHDVIVGDRKGWSKSSIDRWQRQRPGRGRWGPRDLGGNSDQPELATGSARPPSVAEARHTTQVVPGAVAGNDLRRNRGEPVPEDDD
jgi:hypothetical protein